MTWHDAGPADAVHEDAATSVVVAGKQMALFRLEGEVFALYDQCSHGYARLSDGYVEDGCVECPLHQGLVDIRSGAPRSQPIVEAVQSFPARIRDGRVEVQV